MYKVLSPKYWLLLLIGILAFALPGCTSNPSPTPTPTPSPSPSTAYTLPEIKYLIFAKYGEPFYCDPDYYPVARQGVEQQNAITQFPTIQANADEFSAILKQINLPNKADYTDNEKLLIYQQHKKLTYGVQTTASSNGYNYTIRIGQGQGKTIEGNATLSGKITISKQETSFNTCPICLSRGTLIDTPDGPVPVEQLSAGMEVWSVDESGNRFSATIIKTSRTAVPASFQFVRIKLGDGRTITASPGHPSADGRPLGEYKTGERMDGGLIIGIDYVNCEDGFTYDLLASGDTGVYWANGILLESTLSK
jgi:hypothetical protein